MNNLKKESELSRIVLPESHDMRILQAAVKVDKEAQTQIILLGDEKTLRQKINTISGTSCDIKIVNNQDTQVKDKYANLLWKKRKHKGLSREAAQLQLNEPLIFALLMLEAGEADALVAGADTPSQDVVRNAIQIIGMQADCQLVSSFFLMRFDNTHSPYAQDMIFTDCAMNVEPNAQQLSQIANSTIQSAKHLLKEAPKVAFLSFSTNASASHTLVEKVRTATQLTQQAFPEYQIIGDIQIDAALEKQVLEAKYPDANFTPPANILIFPSLEAANIGYKLVQRFTQAKAIGPILQGLNKPVNDLSRGCSVEDIVNTIMMTKNQI